LDFSGSLTFVCTGIVLSVCARTDLVGFLICLGSLIQHFSFADSGLAGSDKNRHSAAFFFPSFVMSMLLEFAYTGYCGMASRFTGIFFFYLA
jgi:hypothetical protein